MMSSYWNALAAEVGIASSQIGLGATLLGKTMPQRVASYATAFFPLSIGFERAGKVILQVDHKLTHNQFTSQKGMKALSHDLASLFDQVEQVCKQRYAGDRTFDRPSDTIHHEIVTVLGAFANKGRYFHLDYLGGAQVFGRDAAAQWWDSVATEVSRRHYGMARRNRDRERAQLLDADFNGAAVIRDWLVNGSEINTVEKAAVANFENEAIVPWCRMYVLQIARWLARILIELGFESLGDPDIPYFADFCGTLNLDDRILRTRKVWNMSQYR